jgi:Na+-driven multidrug efflux pump
MRIMGGVEFAVALAIVASQCLMGAGNTKFVMYAEACLHFGVLIPLSYLLGIALDGGIVGVWIAAAIYCLGLAVVAMLKFRGGGWKTIRI